MFNEAEDPSKNRRFQVTSQEGRDVSFVSKKLSEERLNALKEFLKTAQSSEIQSIRRLYGDNPEVLRAIGLEIDPADKRD